MAQALREVTATLRAQSEHQTRLKGDMGSTERTARQLAKQLKRAKEGEENATATANALQVGWEGVHSLRQARPAALSPWGGPPPSRSGEPYDACPPSLHQRADARACA